MPSDNPAQEQPRRWNGRDLIEVLRGAIDKMKSEGRTDVPIAGLESFLSTAQEKLQNDSVSVPPEVIEHAKMVHASNLAAYEASTASSRELFKSVIDMAKLTVTSLTLINGGSAVALLAFIGQLATAEQPRIPIASFAAPMLFFGVGVGTAAFFGALVFLTQKLYAQRWTKSAVLTSWVSAAIGLSSFAAFAAGSYRAYRVFAAAPTQTPTPTVTSPSMTPTGTSIPTPSATPTSTPTVTPTATPTPTPIARATATPAKRPRRSR